MRDWRSELETLPSMRWKPQRRAFNHSSSRSSNVVNLDKDQWTSHKSLIRQPHSEHIVELQSVCKLVILQQLLQCADEER